MRRFGAFLLSFALLLGLLGAAPSAARAASAVISDMRVGLYQGATRIVLESDRPIAFELFALTAPDRIVLDLPEVGWQMPAKPLPGATGVFQQLRYGLFEPGNSRVVIDLKTPAMVDRAFLLGPGTDAPHRLVVDLKAVSAQRFARLAQLPPTMVTAASPASLENPDEPQPEPAQPEPRAWPEATPQLAASAPVPEKAPPVPAAPGRQLANSTLYREASFRLPPRKPEGAPVLQRWTVIVDPGHGGKDPGTIGVSGIYEKHIVLAIARDLRNELESRGRFDVVLTRDRDRFVDLKERVAFARQHDGDLFVSLHADSIKNRHVAGASVYTLSENASDDVAAELAEHANKTDVIHGVDLSHESADVSNILIDLAQRETMNNSVRFASLLVEDIQGSVPVLTRPHRFAGFRVLKAPDVPSVLIETGFLSNRSDEKRLRSDAHRRKLAKTIADAIERYFTRVEQALR